MARRNKLTEKLARADRSLPSPTGRGIRAFALVAVAVALVPVVVVATGSPTSASSFETLYTTTPPVTWVDDQGRQLMVTSMTIPVGQDGYENRLVVSRDLPTGALDPSWGTFNGRAGLRPLDIEPPAPGTVREGVVAASADGLVTTIWSLPICYPPQACDHWFVQTHADGTQVADPVAVHSTHRAFAALPDGSVLTSNGPSRQWRGPDGTDRGIPPSALVNSSATVDRVGRLVAAVDGDIVRWPVGGVEDLRLDGSWCAPSDNPAIAAAPTDGGFAIVCANWGREPEVRRYEANGELRWAATGRGTDPLGGIVRARSAAINEDDIVFVGGMGTTDPDDSFATVGIVQEFTADGPGYIDYQRVSAYPSAHETSESLGINQLRSVGGSKVAMADHHGCCRSSGGTFPEDSVHARILPPTSSQPRCSVNEADITAANATSLTVQFHGCVETVPRWVPTSYGVTVTSTSGVTVPAPATPGGQVTAVVPITGGQTAWVQVRPATDAGSSLAEASTVAVTVAPFVDLDSFAFRMQADLTTSTSADIRASIVSTARSGTAAPSIAAYYMQYGRAGTIVEPVARLYRAYFLRDPDKGGLTYWTSRRAAGVKLSTISAQFARSAEFTNRYGSLSDQAFVTRLYQNVFGRSPDPAGVLYWTNRLTSGRNNRGQVVLEFSESTEGRRRSAPIVEPLATAYLMLDRLPTSTERAAWAAFVSPHELTAQAILATTEYADRVS